MQLVLRQCFHSFWQHLRGKRKARQRGDLNPCGQSPMDFESITLATRSHCQWSTLTSELQQASVFNRTCAWCAHVWRLRARVHHNLQVEQFCHMGGWESLATVRLRVVRLRAFGLRAQRRRNGSPTARGFEPHASRAHLIFIQNESSTARGFEPLRAEPNGL